MGQRRSGKPKTWAQPRIRPARRGVFRSAPIDPGAALRGNTAKDPDQVKKC
ncbi:hypothetical protein NBRC116586_24120 [Pseudooceanicola nitratireducens]